MNEQAGPGMPTFAGMRAFCFCLLLLTGCENTDLQMATDAGMDAVKALTLSARDVQEIAAQAARFSDAQHGIAPHGSKYVQRLTHLIGEHQLDGRALPFDENLQNMLGRVKAFFAGNFPYLYGQLEKLPPRLTERTVSSLWQKAMVEPLSAP